MDSRAARASTPRRRAGLSPLEPIAGGIRLRLRVQPRASLDAIVGLHGTEIRLRLAAPPVDGAANAALVRFVAATLGVPTRAVTLVSGLGSRSKVVHVSGVTESAARSAFALA